MRLSWIIQMGLKSNDKCHKDTRSDTGEELGVMQAQPRMAWSRQKLGEARSECPREPGAGGPADTSLSDFQPLALQENNFLLF